MDEEEFFVAQCPTVPTLVNTELRFSVKTRQVRRLFNWPLTHLACEEIIPAQPRLQWGRPTFGARYDSFHGIRLGTPANNLTLGTRGTSVSSDSPTADLENQRIGVASMTLGGRFRATYWNDHDLWMLPISDGGDQGDTAGLQLSYNLGPHGIQTGGWTFRQVDLTLRLATGIPDRNQTELRGSRSVYSQVRFNEVERGDLNLNATLTKPGSPVRLHQRLDVGITYNSGRAGQLFQNDLIHHPLSIPEFQKRLNHYEVMVYFRVTNHWLSGD
jgi:hypothetical protein